jgi:hypothetical protein
MAKKRATAKKATTKRAKSKRRVLQVDALETQSIVIVDERGRCRLWAQYLSGPGKNDGATLLQISDSKGVVRLELQVEDRGTSTIRLCTADDHLALSLGATDRLGTGISINDAQRNPSIMIGVTHPESKHPPGPGPRIDVVDWPARKGWHHWDGAYQIPPQDPPT